MKMTEKEFDDVYKNTLDTLLVAMAENEKVAPEKFYGMACVLENLRFFSPVLYGAIRSTKKRPDIDSQQV
ncbi:hypothetical protein [Pontibacter chitinilyticus]|uniref:hypothetical protein n=1 Tax=Pontibacter chitinilyticus TaxID=2674989 RepID=UPI00321B5359